MAQCANAAERLVAQARSCGTCGGSACPGLKARAVVHYSFTYFTPGKIEAFLLTHSGLYAWKCQTGSWKSPWSILLASKSWPGDVGAGFVAQDDVLNLFVEMAWNACGTVPLRRACAHEPLHR